MNCPNCGTETNEAVCPVCGANVGKSKGGLIAAIIAAVIVIVAAAVVLVFFAFGMSGKKNCEKVIDIYMTGLAEADSDKITSVIDPDCINEDDLQDVADAFELLKSMGIEYTLDYNIASIEAAADGDISNMCEELYGEEVTSKDIKSAYICDVEYTMSMTFLEQTETEDDNLKLICYKKDGKWYVGGSVSE
jgi:hypothetical protein